MAAVEHAVILVGGRGTRLGDLARDVPKPLVEIAAGRPFLDLLIAQLEAAGVRDILLLAGHLGTVARARYDGARVGAAQVSVFIESEPAGTAGALRLAQDRLADAFYLLNGDSFFDFDPRRLADALRPDDRAAIALRRIDDPSRYGAVDLEGDRIVRFREKQVDLKGSALISGGVYAVRKAILADVGPPPCSIESDVFPALAARGQLAGAAFEGYFLDIGLPDTLAQARRELAARFAAL